MPKRITTTVYTYAELLKAGNKRAIEKAKAWLRDAAVHDDWYEETLELWKNALSQVGFEDAEIMFSGFSSQGDGASFTSRCDVERLIEFFTTKIEPNRSIDEDDLLPYVAYKVANRFDAAFIAEHGAATSEYNPQFRKLKLIADLIYAKVYRTNSHYYHYNTCDTDVELQDNRTKPRVEKLITEFRDSVEDLRESLSKVIYKELEEDYYALLEDDNLEDVASANEYTFTKSGERFG